jgi:hypothetical protein
MVPDVIGLIVSGYGAASFLADCNFRGSLAAGAPCNENFQCASAVCLGAHETLGTGGPLPSTCGACAPTAAVGESCSSSGCGPGAICSGGAVCVAVTYGALGASCAANASLCAPGLYCTPPPPQVGRCVGFPGNVGDSCSNSISCAGTLVCEGTPQTCQQPVPTGGSCSIGQDCAYGLVCVQSTSPGVCTAITSVMPGESCGFGTQCLVGSCYGDGPQLSAPLADGGVSQPTCPTVIPDGQPCSYGGSTTCGTYSACFDSKSALSGTGVCTPIDGYVCR